MTSAPIRASPTFDTYTVMASQRRATHRTPRTSSSTDEHGIERHFSIKRMVFDWSSIVAIAVAAATYGAMQSEAAKQDREIQTLRAKDAQRDRDDVTKALNSATKADVQALSSQIENLRLEMMRQRIGGR